MKIGELLEAPLLMSSKLVAGAKGMNRSVSSVNMMDSPDIFDYLRPHELLLTTAYAVRDQPEVLVRLVQEMAVIGSAGLGIKTKRYYEQIPAEVKDEADRLRLPLIELALDCPLAETVQQLLSRILENRTDEMRHALDSHRRLSALIMEGRSLDDMIDTLSRLVSMPVLLTDAEGGILASCSHFPGKQLPSPSQLLRLLGNVPLSGPPRPTFLHLDDAPGPWKGILAGAIHTMQLRGYLIAFCREPQAEEQVYLTLEQAANVVSFELLKNQAVKERSRRYKNDLLSDVVDGLLTHDHEILHRARKYGLEGDQPYLCMVIKKDSPEAAPGESARLKERDFDTLYDAVKKASRDEGMNGLLFVKNDGLVMLLPWNEEILQGTEEALLAERLRRIADAVWDIRNDSLSFGIGNPAGRLSHLQRSYKEAAEAFGSGRLARKRRFVQFHHVRELVDLLRMLPLQERNAFIQDTFRAMAAEEDKERGELLHTLRVYYDQQAHIAETSKQLFVHRNTVIYRLAKIEQLTGRSLRSPSDSLRFRIAFQMAELGD